MYLCAESAMMNPSAATYTPRFRLPSCRQTTPYALPSWDKTSPPQLATHVMTVVTSSDDAAVEAEKQRAAESPAAVHAPKHRVMQRYSREKLLQLESETLIRVAHAATERTSLYSSPLPTSFVRLARQLPHVAVDEVLDTQRAAALVSEPEQGRYNMNSTTVRRARDNCVVDLSCSTDSNVHGTNNTDTNKIIGSSGDVGNRSATSNVRSASAHGKMSQTAAGDRFGREHNSLAAASRVLGNVHPRHSNKSSSNQAPPSHRNPAPRLPTEHAKAIEAPDKRGETTVHSAGTVLSSAVKETSLAIIRAITSPLYTPGSTDPFTHASSSTLSQSATQIISVEAMRDYGCCVCCSATSNAVSQPCAALGALIHRVHCLVLRNKCYGACLMQSGDVLWGLLQLALVFEVKQSSLRMRRLAERCPAVVRGVAEYLCGDGYHMPLPPVTDHDSWSGMTQLLCFDAIRDNRTRIKTDLSKHWRRRRIPFEQFVFFFTHRDDRPRVQVRNIITRSVKPGMVAMLSGNVVAMVLLSRLGFFIPPDKYWKVYPFLKQSLGEDTLLYGVVRHLARYLSCTQDPSMYDPIGEPFV